MNANIRRNPSGKYFVSLGTVIEVAELSKSNSVVGVLDLETINIAILSDGTIYSNPKFFRTLEEKLVKPQQTMSRRTIGGANWYKAKRKVARIHERITNARNI
ncbi:MAG: transposase [Neobacillus sp.]|nr:transposase [Neobacillus sp.]